MKAMFRGFQKLQRPNACKLVEDGSECYVAYRDFGLHQLVKPEGQRPQEQKSKKHLTTSGKAAVKGSLNDDSTATKSSDVAFASFK